mgnify:CR=1 FL=1
MKLALVGSRYFAATVFEMLRRLPGVDLTSIVAPAADDRLALAFRDDGAAFDPLARADPDLDAGIDERPIGGLGIFLVRELAESVSYERIGRDNVLRVHLRASARHGNQENA